MSACCKNRKYFHQGTKQPPLGEFRTSSRFNSFIGNVMENKARINSTPHKHWKWPIQLEGIRLSHPYWKFVIRTKSSMIHGFQILLCHKKCSPFKMVYGLTSLCQSMLILISLVRLSSALPRLRKAPEECPLQNGNLLDTILFVQSSEECEEMCSNSEKCLFFYYYAGSGSNQVDATNQPAQCFLYDQCNRKVMKATNICPLNR